MKNKKIQAVVKKAHTKPAKRAQKPAASLRPAVVPPPRAEVVDGTKKKSSYACDLESMPLQNHAKVSGAYIGTNVATSLEQDKPQVVLPGRDEELHEAPASRIGSAVACGKDEEDMLNHSKHPFHLTIDTDFESGNVIVKSTQYEKPDKIVCHLQMRDDTNLPKFTPQKYSFWFHFRAKLQMQYSGTSNSSHTINTSTKDEVEPAQDGENLPPDDHYHEDESQQKIFTPPIQVEFRLQVRGNDPQPWKGFQVCAARHVDKGGTRTGDISNSHRSTTTTSTRDIPCAEQSTADEDHDDPELQWFRILNTKCSGGFTTGSTKAGLDFSPRKMQTNKKIFSPRTKNSSVITWKYTYFFHRGQHQEDHAHDQQGKKCAAEHHKAQERRGGVRVRAKSEEFSQPQVVRSTSTSRVHFKEEVVSFAYYPPYSIARCDKFLRELVAIPGAEDSSYKNREQDTNFHPMLKICTTLETIGYSEQGRPLQLLSLHSSSLQSRPVLSFGRPDTNDSSLKSIMTSERNSPCSGMTRRTRNLWVVCRQHPGESIASFILEGFLREILCAREDEEEDKHMHQQVGSTATYSTTRPSATVCTASSTTAGKNNYNYSWFELFRQHPSLCLRVVPLANPDGVALGNWYTNSKGVNMNQDWFQAKSKEVRVITAAMGDGDGKNKESITSTRITQKQRENGLCEDHSEVVVQHSSRRPDLLFPHLDIHGDESVLKKSFLSRSEVLATISGAGEGSFCVKTKTEDTSGHHVCTTPTASTAGPPGSSTARDSVKATTAPAIDHVHSAKIKRGPNYISPAYSCNFNMVLTSRGSCADAVDQYDADEETRTSTTRASTGASSTSTVSTTSSCRASCSPATVEPTSEKNLTSFEDLMLFPTRTFLRDSTKVDAGEKENNSFLPDEHQVEVDKDSTSTSSSSGNFSFSPDGNDDVLFSSSSRRPGVVVPNENADVNFNLISATSSQGPAAKRRKIKSEVAVGCSSAGAVLTPSVDPPCTTNEDSALIGQLDAGAGARTATAASTSEMVLLASSTSKSSTTERGSSCPAKQNGSMKTLSAARRNHNHLKFHALVQDLTTALLLCGKAEDEHQRVGVLSSTPASGSKMKLRSLRREYYGNLYDQLSRNLQRIISADEDHCSTPVEAESSGTTTGREGNSFFHRRKNSCAGASTRPSNATRTKISSPKRVEEVLRRFSSTPRWSPSAPKDEHTKRKADGCFDCRWPNGITVEGCMKHGKILTNTSTRRPAAQQEEQEQPKPLASDGVVVTTQNNVVSPRSSTSSSSTRRSSSWSPPSVVLNGCSSTRTLEAEALLYGRDLAVALRRVLSDILS
ncbi:unnamed protein product [Amoebophrya sp. A120]|nr:unnamed protein product [Amoebophrya sp. A120]|eukprot:GSA120T00016232001.1